MEDKTYFKEYQWQLDLKKDGKISSLGLTSGSTYYQDPKRLLFSLSRYKFVSKMFNGLESVCEVGCGDGFYSRIVRQTVKKLDCYDIDPIFIKDAKTRNDSKLDINYKVNNFLINGVEQTYNGIFSLDVLEHIHKNDENQFILNILKSLDNNGSLLIGMPSLCSQPFATADKDEHVNCKNADELKKLFNNYFYNTFIFSMNDEIVHTGFEMLAHYYLILCVGKK